MVARSEVRTLLVDTLGLDVREMQDSSVCCGFGSEIARVVGKAAFDYLESPIEVVGTTVPLPFSPSLEAVVLPGESDLVSAVRGCLGRL